MCVCVCVCVLDVSILGFRVYLSSLLWFPLRVTILDRARKGTAMDATAGVG